MKQHIKNSCIYPQNEKKKENPKYNHVVIFIYISYGILTLLHIAFFKHMQFDYKHIACLIGSFILVGIVLGKNISKKSKLS